jgi:hypothetical protein
VPVAQQLRETAEFHLREAAEDEMLRRHPDRGAPRRYRPDTVATAFWRGVFVPAYHRLPWWLRRAALRAMPGSHHRRWTGR